MMRSWLQEMKQNQHTCTLFCRKENILENSPVVKIKKKIKPPKVQFKALSDLSFRNNIQENNRLLYLPAVLKVVIPHLLQNHVYEPRRDEFLYLNTL